MARSFTDLPGELINKILQSCDTETLGRLRQTCRFLYGAGHPYLFSQVIFDSAEGTRIRKFLTLVQCHEELPELVRDFQIERLGYKDLEFISLMPSLLKEPWLAAVSLFTNIQRLTLDGVLGYAVLTGIKLAPDAFSHLEYCKLSGLAWADRTTVTQIRPFWTAPNLKIFILQGAHVFPEREESIHPQRLSAVEKVYLRAVDGHWRFTNQLLQTRGVITLVYEDSHCEFVGQALGELCQAPDVMQPTTLTLSGYDLPTLLDRIPWKWICMTLAACSRQQKEQRLNLEVPHNPQLRGSIHRSLQRLIQNRGWLRPHMKYLRITYYPDPFTCQPGSWDRTAKYPFQTREFNLLDLDHRLLHPLQENEPMPNTVADLEVFRAREELWGRPGAERERYFAVVEKVREDLAEELVCLRRLQTACDSVGIKFEAFSTTGRAITGKEAPGWSQICRTSMPGLACLSRECWEWEGFDCIQDLSQDSCGEQDKRTDWKTHEPGYVGYLEAIRQNWP